MAKPKAVKSKTGKETREATKAAMERSARKPGKSPIKAVTPRSFIVDFGFSVAEYSSSSDSDDLGSEWDIGVFEIYDGASRVGLLYVTNPYNDLTQSKEYWALSKSYIWPSQTTIKTFKYQGSAGLTAVVNSVSSFKTECEKIWAAADITYIKSTNTPF